MRWFGESWGAPVCDGEHVPTPVGKTCPFCSAQIIAGDRGLVLVQYGPENLVDAFVPYHLNCLMMAVAARPT